MSVCLWESKAQVCRSVRDLPQVMWTLISAQTRPRQLGSIEDTYVRSDKESQW